MGNGVFTDHHAAHRHGGYPILLFGVLAAIASIFAIDTLTPLGIATPLLYVLVVWSCLAWAPPRQVVAVAAVCSGILVVSYFFPDKGGDAAAGAVNRGLTLLAIGFVTYYGLARRRAVDELRRRESELRDFVENATVGIHWVAPDGTVLYANREELEMMGYARDEYLGRNIADFHVEREVIDGMLSRINAGETLREFPARVRRKDGTVRRVRVSSSAYRENGKFVHTRCFTRDVTDQLRADEAESESRALKYNNLLLRDEVAQRQRVEAALRDTESRYRHLVESVQAIVWQCDAENGRFSFVSKEAETLLGYPVAAWTEPGFWPAHMHPEDREWVPRLCAMSTKEQDHFQFEYRMLASDGRTVWLRDCVRVIRSEGRAAELVGVMVDVTERKLAEATLREQEELLRIIVNGAPVGINMSEPSGRLVTNNAKYRDLVGYSEDELRGKSGIDLTHPDDRPANLKLRGELLRGERDYFELEKRYIRKDGTVIWVRNRVSLVRHPDGTPRYTVAVVQDITKRKLAEQQLSDAEQRSRLLIEGVRDYAIFMLDTAGRVASWNPGAERIKGYRESEILGEHFSVFFPPEDKAAGKPDAELDEARATGSAEDEGWRVRKDGSRFWASVLITALRDDKDRVSGFVKITRDATERRETQEQLRATAEDLRRLAAKRAELQEQERRELSRELHDRVGQNLTALSINLNILAGEIAPVAGAAARKRVTDSLRLVDATADCVEDVMTDLRPPMLDDYGLLAAIRWYAKQFEQRTGIATQVSGAESGKRLRSEAELALFRITQEALNNLAKHARAERAEISLAEDNGNVRLEIADRGVGFEPDGGGNGGRRGSWGMLTMRERAAAAGGRLNIASAPGKGTRITVDVRR